MAGAGTAKQKRFWLYLLLSTIVLSCLATTLSSWREYRRLSHISGRVEVFVGIYPNTVQGQFASLQCLSEEIVRHPHADSFVMRRTGTVFASDDIDWYETIYDRRSHTIVDGKVWAGDTEAWSSVSDTVVERVTMSSHGFQEFGRSGCKNILP